MVRWLTIVCAMMMALPAAAEPIAQWDFEAPDAVKAWSARENVSLAPGDEGVLEATIDVSEGRGGWFRTTLPEADYSDFAGIAFRWRAPEGVAGDFGVRFVHVGEETGKIILSADVSALAESGGEWVQAWVPFGEMEQLTGAPGALRIAPLGPSWFLMIFPGVRSREDVTFAVDDVTLVRQDQAADIAMQVAREQRRRPLDVFPVRPTGGSVETDWYATSGEGSHPRLQYTVSAVAPRFVMVLVPRIGDIPRPEVTALDGPAGAEIRWPGAADRVLFGGGGHGGMTLDGAAGFIRARDGAPDLWALMDGTMLG